MGCSIVVTYQDLNPFDRLANRILSGRCARALMGAGNGRCFRARALMFSSRYTYGSLKFSVNFSYDKHARPRLTAGTSCRIWRQTAVCPRSAG